MDALSTQAVSVLLGLVVGLRLRRLIRGLFTLTALAGRISSPLLTGVGPKKMQNAFPGGQ